MQKKVFETEEEASLWVAKGRKNYDRAGYFEKNYHAWSVKRWRGARLVKTDADSEMWSASETIRQRLGLDPPGVGTRARLAGSATSEVKAATSAANGQKYGGRPRGGVPRSADTPHTVTRSYTLSPAAVARVAERCNGNASMYIENLILKDGT